MRMTRRAALGLLALSVSSLAPAVTRSAQVVTAAEREAAAERFRAFAFDDRWRDLLTSVPGVEVGPDGLVRLNRDGIRYPELQSVGESFVRRGILNGREDWREQGWRILDAGTQGIGADGRLPGPADDHVHSSTYLLAGLGQALILDPPNASPARIRTFLRAAAYMAGPAVVREGEMMAARFTHRAFIWSLMFRAAFVLGGEERFEALATGFMRRGLDAQRHDATFPENGGFDALYQLIGTDFLLAGAALEPEEDAGESERWAAQRSLSLLGARIAFGGRLDAEGSTRVWRELNREGVPKRLSHWQIAIPLRAGAILLEQSVFDDYARQAMECRAACQAGEEP